MDKIDNAQIVLYTVPEVAEMLKVKKGYIYDLIATNQLIAIKLSERRTRISSDQLEKFILSNDLHNGGKRDYNKPVQSPSTERGTRDAISKILKQKYSSNKNLLRKG